MAYGTSAQKIELIEVDGIVSIGCTDVNMDALLEIAKWAMKI